MVSALSREKDRRETKADRLGIEEDIEKIKGKRKLRRKEERKKKVG